MTSLLERAREDVGVFAEALVGEPLWPHQLEVVRSPARIRAMLTGRQAGKSRTLAILALHQAFTVPGSRTLIISAGDDAAKDLLAEIAMLAASSVLGGSVVDDLKAQITLSTGSTIRSIPASQKQARGKSVDLLVLDEACFIEPEIWTAAKYTMIARPGSRVVMTSTPFGRSDHFFAVTYRAGLAGEEGFASWHWPSTVSPLVDTTLLEQWRKTSSDREYRQEVLAEWVDDAGAYFSSEEIVASVADYRMIDPNEARGQLVVGGVDFGLARDANTLVLLGVLADGEVNDHLFPSEPVFFIAHLEEHFKMPYSVFAERVVEVADQDADRFYVTRLASEVNGVGAAPTEMLRQRAYEQHTGMWVEPVHTDNRRKMSMFGTVKLLLQQGRLVVPRHPSLLRQLDALEYETTESGNVRIAVPERAGHDDLVMALGQAVSCVNHTVGYRPTLEDGAGRGELLATKLGTRIHEQPRCAWMRRAFTSPKGADTGDGW